MAPEPAPVVTEQPSGTQTGGSVRFVGRVEQTGPTSARYAWSGAGFVSRFVGTGIALRLRDQDNLHTVVIDGREFEPIRTTHAQSEYPVAAGLPATEHTLEVYRRTEASFGITELQGIAVSDGHLLQPPAPPTTLVEVVGDSISCGYGNLGTSPECPFTAETENHYLTWGSLIARRLGAEISTVAWSGRGVVKNYDGQPGDLMPALYNRTLPQDANSRWSFSRPASLVLVNLGTNDFSTSPDPSIGAFAQAYAALLAQIRDANPDALILCTVGPMLGADDLTLARQGINTAVAARRGQGDTRVQSFELAATNDKPGCSWHPSVPTHERMAQEVLQHLVAQP